MTTQENSWWIIIRVKIYESDPFAKLDQNGVGQLMEMAVTKGRSQRPNLKIGICGEHGGDPSSVAFCHKVGMDYVSCSPFRVPIARSGCSTGSDCQCRKVEERKYFLLHNADCYKG